MSAAKTTEAAHPRKVMLVAFQKTGRAAPKSRGYEACGAMRLQSVFQFEKRGVPIKHLIRRHVPLSRPASRRKLPAENEYGLEHTHRGTRNEKKLVTGETPIPCRDRTTESQLISISAYEKSSRGSTPFFPRCSHQILRARTHAFARHHQG